MDTMMRTLETTVTGLLRADHHRLDQLLDEVTAMVAHGELERAAESLADFSERLERHFALEEGVLFPAFERATGLLTGPTRVMREEHAEIRELVSSMAEMLTRRDVPGFVGARQLLEDVLPSHHAKEERVLYPATDRALHGEERRVLLQRVRGQR